MICKKPAGQLNALLALKSFLNRDQRNIITDSFIYSNFNCCIAIWHFCSKRLMTKNENIQERNPQFGSNDYTSYYEALLNKSKTNVPWKFMEHGYEDLRFFHSINEFNPVYMQSLFKENINFKRQKKDYLKVPIRNSVMFGEGM